MSTTERLAKMAQETTPDQWVSIFSELHEQIVDLEQQLEAAERRNAEQDKGIVLTEAEREAIQRLVNLARITQRKLQSELSGQTSDGLLRDATTAESLLARAGAEQEIINEKHD